ncbi:hypothetical protein CW304_20885 [Bacillus sp. UFRGS-B20]|nr:hypothetical protein CW304_20885 [Bacillus sp. UFRGS-B20]
MQNTSSLGKFKNSELNDSGIPNWSPRISPLSSLTIDLWASKCSATYYHVWSGGTDQSNQV